MMTLGYANPSFADRPTCTNNTHCDHGDDPTETETTFSVEVVTNVANGGVDTTGDTVGGCAGTSTPSLHLTVNFFVDDRSDCGRVVIYDGATEIPVYLLHIATKQTKKVDTVSIFFTEKATPAFAGNEWEWNSDPLPVTITRNDDGSVDITEINSGASFQLTKTHQPRKRTVSDGAGGITVGTIIYTPTSSSE